MTSDVDTVLVSLSLSLSLSSSSLSLSSTMMFYCCGAVVVGMEMGGWCCRKEEKKTRARARARPLAGTGGVASF